MAKATASSGDPIWFSDYTIIFDQARLVEFFPTKDQTREEKINAILRFGIYTGVILSVYHSDASYMYITLGIALFSYIVYKMKSNTNTNVPVVEGMDNGAFEGGNLPVTNCTRPTLDNPFMNVTMKDYLNVNSDGQIKERLPACDANDGKIKREADDAFNNNLYRDVNDLFGKFNSQRQFYTMPSTTIPNNQGEFANWLYKSPKTCKEDSDYCYRYEDLRANRPVFVDPDVNPVVSGKLNVEGV